MPIPLTKSQVDLNYLNKITLLFGAPKSGKSTLASRLGDEENKILFFATERGHNFLEVYKWQTNYGTDPTSWEHFKQAVVEVTKQNDFKCLAIDTVDNLFDWCRRYVNKKHNLEHESDAGFGKGYAYIKEEFSAPINYLTQKGIGVMFISHSKTEDKELVNKKVTYTDSTLPSTAKKIIHGLCDYIFYVGVDIDGSRFLLTKGNETVNAGDRSGRLPARMKLDAEEVKKALKGSLPEREKREVKNYATNETKEVTL